MKRYSIIHVPVLSFFSKPLYRDVCAHWKGTGLAYLLLLLALCWVPPIVRMHRDLARFIDNELPKIIVQIPVITIVEGNASIEEPQPYYIRDPKTGKAVVVIDTTGTITSLADADAMGLVTRTEAIFQKNKIETRTFSFKEIKNFTLNADRITSWLSVAKQYVALVVYPLALGGAFVSRTLQVLLYAAIGLLLASWCKSRRTYSELIRLSVIALTPCIIVKTVLATAQVHVPRAGLLYFLAAMGYLWFGIKAAAADVPPSGAFVEGAEGFE